MALLLGVAFFAVPFVEILVIIEVGSRIGWDSTVAILVVLCAGGAWLVKREGLDSWRRVQTGLHQGRMPTSDVIDAFLVLIAGVLLLCPGFITSACGIALIFPPIRREPTRWRGDGSELASVIGSGRSARAWATRSRPGPTIEIGPDASLHPTVPTASGPIADPTNRPSPSRARRCRARVCARRVATTWT